MSERLPKEQRLHSKKAIDDLFDNGKGFFIYPFRVIPLKSPSEGEQPMTRMLISVSKKRFHRAVKRNRVKRLVREAWRKNKSLLDALCIEKSCIFDVALVYSATVILPYSNIERTIKRVFETLEKDYFKNEENLTPAT